MLITGVIGWAALSGAAVQVGGPAIEHDLATRTRAALAAAGIPGEVSTDGRDITVRAGAGRRDEVLDALAGSDDPVSLDARSVRVVTDPVPPTSAPSTTTPPTTTPVTSAPAPTTVPPTTVPPTTVAPATTTAPATTVASSAPETTDTAAPVVASAPDVASAGDPTFVAVRARLDETGAIELTGRVFSVIEEAALVLTAGTAVGAERVTNSLVVVEGDTVLGDAHVAGLVRIVELFGADLTAVTAEVIDGVVHVTGLRPPGRSLDRLAAAIVAGEAQGVRFDLRVGAAGTDGTEG